MDELSQVVIRCEARGFPFDVQGDAEIRETLVSLFDALRRRSGSPLAVFSIGRSTAGQDQWHVRVDGQAMIGCEQRGEALHALIVYINQRVVKARDDLLSIHAAAVATAAGAVVLPGDSGSGKTTLCARLLQHGTGYLSDDSVALDRDGRLLGYPKPLGFKAGTWEHFSDAGIGDLDLDGAAQHVWQIPPSRLGATSVTAAHPAAIVLPRFEPGAPLRVEPVSRQAAAVGLLGQAQNLLAFGVPDALELIGRLAARVPGYAIVYGDARQAAQAVLDLIEPAKGSVGTYLIVPPEVPRGAPAQPYPAADVSAVCFEDGAILVRGESGQFVTVDRVGALIWPLVDGQRTVESIAIELAPLFGAPRSEVEAGVSRWVADLVESGFLLVP